MSIWKTTVTKEAITDFCKKTLVELVGIEFTEIGDDFLKGRMPVDHRTYQPYGIMHGGASCILAETLASIGANYCVDQATEFCVGLDINTSHVRMIKTGYVYGTATPIHLGKTTQIWEVRIVNDKDQLISITRLTLFVLERRHS